MPASDVIPRPALSPRPRRTRRGTAAVVRVVLSLALLAAGAVAFWPAALGGATSYVVVSGDSMLPTLRPGDLVVLRAGGRYDPGDVVAYRPPPGDIAEHAVVIHRLGPPGPDGSLTARGDHNTHDDPWTVTQDRVLGRVWLHVPGIGRALVLLRSPLALGLLAGLGAVWTVVRLGRAEE